jgi:hypothetical protein
MRTKESLKLTEEDIRLLDIAANTDDHSYAWLAELAQRKLSTVKTRFRDILWEMEVHDCGCAVQEALRLEIVRFEPTKFVKRAEHEERERNSRRTTTSIGGLCMVERLYYTGVNRTQSHEWRG